MCFGESLHCRAHQVGLVRLLPGPEHFCFQKEPGKLLKKDRGIQWHAQSQEWRGTLNVSKTASPWTDRSTFRGYGGDWTPRTKDLVDCTVMQVCLQQGVKLRNIRQVMDNLMKPIILDVSQSHRSREYTNAQGVHKCLTTSSSLYIFEQDRVASGKEHLALQGWEHSKRRS